MKQAIAVAVVLVALTIVGINQGVDEDATTRHYQQQVEGDAAVIQDVFADTQLALNGLGMGNLPEDEAATLLYDASQKLDDVRRGSEARAAPEPFEGFHSLWNQALSNMSTYLDVVSGCIAAQDADCAARASIEATTTAQLNQAVDEYARASAALENAPVACDAYQFQAGETNPVVAIHTNFGCIYAEIFVDAVPTTGGNFVALAQDGYYDASPFHRVIPDFMMQGGDFTQGNGRGGEAHPDYANAQGNIADEFHPDLRHDGPGKLSMANAGPNTGSSQFFITFGATPWLDDRHAVFGEVVQGMDVVQTINVEAGNPSSNGVPPLKPVDFQKATVYFPEAA